MSRQITLIAGAPQEFFEVANFLRILSASAPLTIEFYNAGREVAEAVNVSKGYAEKFDTGTFDRVRLYSDTTQDVQFVTRLGNTVQYDAAPVGDTAIVSSVPLALDAATIAGLTRQAYGAAFSSAANLGAGATEQVFSAAANVNGAIILSAEWISANAGTANPRLALHAHTAAPATFADGAKLMVLNYVPPGTGVLHVGRLNVPITIPAGNGLWFRNDGVAESNAARSVLYTLL